MKYILLMQCTRKEWESLGSWNESELRAHVQFMLRLNAELAEAGELVAAEGLDVPANAKIVRAKRADAPQVSDGPFAESKEFLAGFWIVDVANVERAIAIAAKASTAPGPGGVPFQTPIELRQVMAGPPIDA